MNILYVCMSNLTDNSSAARRNQGMILGLAALGHTVDTLSLEKDVESFAYDPDLLPPEEVRASYYFKQNPLYATVRRKREYPASVAPAGRRTPRTFLRSSAKALFEAFAIYDAQKVNVANVLHTPGIDFRAYDVMITSSDPKSAHLLAELIRKKHPSMRWIQYWGDPMATDISKGYSALKKWLAKREEARLLVLADRIVYTSPFTLERQKRLFASAADKMAYANQAVVCYTQGGVDESFSAKEKSLLIGYFGTYFSVNRTIDPLYRAFAKAPKYRFLLCGQGDIPFPPLENIELRSQVPSGEAAKLEQSCDVLVCLCNKAGAQIPGKIYYNAAMNKPIIVILDGEEAPRMREYFKRFGRFILCDNTEDSILGALEQAQRDIREGKTHTVPDAFYPKSVAAMLLGQP